MQSVEVKTPTCSYLGKHDWREISDEPLFGGKVRRTYRCIHCLKVVSIKR